MPAQCKAQAAKGDEVYFRGVYNAISRLSAIKMSFNLNSPAEIQRILAERLRLQRLAQGLPQRELAAMAGLSLGALRKLEKSGQCSLQTLLRAVQALGLSAELEDLFVLRRQTIAEMEAAEQVVQRRRAPRRRAS